MAYLLASLGGALGALARWSVTAAAHGGPWATLLVNLTGCLLIGGLLAVALARFPTSTWVRPFFAVGILGGYTTYSTFALDVVRLTGSGAWQQAVGYLAASVLGGVGCVLAGLLTTRALLHLRESVLAELEAGEDQS